MKTYRFRLEPLLTLRTWEEERARAAFGQAARQEQAFVHDLSIIDGRIDRHFRVCNGTAGTIEPANARTQRWRHVLVLQREREDAVRKLATARRFREQQMKLLIETHRRVEVLKTLKSKRKETHLAAERKREDRELDDMISARFQPDLRS